MIVKLLNFISTVLFSLATFTIVYIFLDIILQLYNFYFINDKNKMSLYDIKHLEDSGNLKINFTFSSYKTKII